MKRRRPALPCAMVALVAVTLLHLASLAAATQLPFRPAETAAAAIQRRQSGCIANFYSCAGVGAAFANICCENGQTCALDANSQPACCPAGAVCTGTAPATFVTPSAAGPTSVSYVPNGFFSFPFIATPFADQAACTAALNQCSQNYAACTADLQGAVATAPGYGVTIVVPGGGGTTVAPGTVAAPSTTLAAASAASVCSSLSSQACFGLQSSVCTQFGTGFVGGGSGAAPTAAPPRHAVLAGAAVAAGVVYGAMI